MKQLIIASLLLFVLHISAQVETTPDTLKSVDQLNFIIGTWEGDGWMLGRDRERKSFVQKETIERKINGQVLVVNGLGHAGDEENESGKIVHEAFGIISALPENDVVTMISFSEQNGRLEAEMHFIGNKQLQWAFESNGRTIRFTEDFSEPGKWHEIGEISMDGENWFKFMEMDLKKREAGSTN